MPSRSPDLANGARARGVLFSLVQKELREITRDGRFWMVAAAIALLLVVALSFGFRQSAAIRAERAAAQATADDHFRGQDEKNPHVAAHYGTYVFKPGGALAFVDPGVDPFVGVSIKLQAHERTPPEGAQAQDTTSMARVGRLSVAMVLQLLVPLLIIGLGFSAWTAERERGTFRLLATTGVSALGLFAGKAVGLAAALGVLLVPAVLLGALVVASFGDGPTPAGRLAVMAVAYLTYFCVFLGLTLGASARAHSSRGALVTLLGAWVFMALVMPRAASSVAAMLAPTPPPKVIATAIRESLAEGLPGGPAREARIDAITEGMLEEQGFKGAETLMDAAHLGGIELSAEAQFENEVIDFHYARWADAIERQEAASAWLGLLSPPVAMQALSAALAGTDYQHHRHFADAAEAHRRALIEMLNREFAEKGGSDGWSYAAGRDTWERAPAFRYERPPLAAVLARVWVSVFVLGAWLTLTLLFAVSAARRMRVV